MGRGLKVEWWAVMARVNGVTNHPAKPKQSEQPGHVPGFFVLNVQNIENLIFWPFHPENGLKLIGQISR